jgi:hypothetical protein
LIISDQNEAISSTKSPRVFRAVATSRRGHPAVAARGAAMRTISYFRVIPEFNYSNFGNIKITQTYYIYKYI